MSSSASPFRCRSCAYVVMAGRVWGERCPRCSCSDWEELSDAEVRAMQLEEMGRLL